MKLLFMEIKHSLWPIWYDYLEEQGQNTEFFSNFLYLFTILKYK